jgi:hypothetical protein
MIGDVWAAHYSGTVDQDLLLRTTADSLGLTADQYQQLLRHYAKLGAGGTTLDVWIGPDGLPLRDRATTHIQAVSDKTDMVVDAKFSQWGEKVDVTPPPASQAKDVSQEATSGA